MQPSVRQFVAEAFTAYGPVLTRRATILLGDPSRAEEVVQETFITLIREVERGAMATDALTLSWLYRVTTNKSLNIKRTYGRTVYTDAFEGLCRQEKRDLALVLTLHRWLGLMPAKYREIIVYRFIDEMTVDEIVELTGHSRRTVHRRLTAIKSWLVKRAPELGVDLNGAPATG